MNDAVLTREEKVVFALRELYRRYGYLPYRMSKFEEYELYVRNKEFMVGDRVIAFNDTNGKMLALKPDVTLSIIKGGEDRPATASRRAPTASRRSGRRGWSASGRSISTTCSRRSRSPARV